MRMNMIGNQYEIRNVMEMKTDQGPDEQFLNRPISDSQRFPRVSTDEIIGSLENEKEGIHTHLDETDLSVLKSVNTMKLKDDHNNVGIDGLSVIDDDAEDRLLDDENTEGIIAVDLDDGDDDGDGNVEYDMDLFQTPE